MTKISATETESEWQKVKTTNEVSVVRCDVCEHDYDEDEWDGREFSVAPSIDRESETLQEFSELFDAYHTSIPKHFIEDGCDGTEMVFDVPQKDFHEVLQKELDIIIERQGRDERTQLAIEGLKESIADKIGTHSFYILDNEIHHFRYVLNIEASTEDHKHVCDDCYEVLFE